MRYLLASFIFACNVATNQQVEDNARCLVLDPEPPIENICQGEYNYSPFDFSEKELYVIFTAVLEFNTFFGKDLISVNPISVEKNNCNIYVQDIPGTIAGRYTSEGNIIIDFKVIEEMRFFKRYLQHELGHSLGMVHARSGIMCGFGGNHSLNEEDISQAKELGLID